MGICSCSLGLVLGIYPSMIVFPTYSIQTLTWLLYAANAVDFFRYSGSKVKSDIYPQWFSTLWSYQWLLSMGYARAIYGFDFRLAVPLDWFPSQVSVPRLSRTNIWVRGGRDGTLPFPRVSHSVKCNRWYTLGRCLSGE